MLGPPWIIIVTRKIEATPQNHNGVSCTNTSQIQLKSVMGRVIQLSRPACIFPGETPRMRE